MAAEQGGTLGILYGILFFCQFGDDLVARLMFLALGFFLGGMLGYLVGDYLGGWAMPAVGIAGLIYFLSQH